MTQLYWPSYMYHLKPPQNSITSKIRRYTFDILMASLTDVSQVGYLISQELDDS